MRVIKGRNVNLLLPQAVRQLHINGDKVSSRGMKVLEFPEQVASVYEHPRERVLFSPERDANPFFHFMEGLWIIGGRNDVEFISRYNSKIHEYSDDGEVFHGAYGYRLRQEFGFDQVAMAIDRLKREPDTRQVVLQIWSADLDLNQKSLDIPCNDLIMFKVKNGKLNMTIANRSNDLIWGCYGANAVHFSMLQEYIANMVGVNVGTYTQVSDSLHAYLDNPQWKKLIDRYVRSWEKVDNPYKFLVRPYDRIVHIPELFDEELEQFFVDGEKRIYKNTFLTKVAVPMKQSWDAYKNREIETALEYCNLIEATDWSLACYQWLRRRQK